MKICSPQLGISPNSSLGGEIYDYQTLRGFTQRGVKVFVYLPKNRPYDKTLKNFSVEYCFITHIIPPWIYSFICLPYLFRTYEKEKFDILRIHSPRFLGLAAIVFHFFYPRVPIMSSQVTVDSSPIYFPIEMLTLRISRIIIVQSQYMKNAIIKKYNISPKKIAVTYGGQLELVKTSKYVPKEAKNINTGTPLILFMGVLIKRKNPTFLVDLLKKCKAEIPNLKLVIIGNGPEKKAIIKSIKEYNLEKEVTLIESAYGDSKAYWLSRMNIFLMPSHDEGFGLAATEAMSFAKPVITSNKAAFEEIIESGQNGFTLPLEDQEKWSETIVRLIKSSKLAKKIGNGAKKTALEKFNWENTFNINFKVAKEMIK
jgi:glycosyltransferase involved in cell wall biosynthesis